MIFNAFVMEAERIVSYIDNIQTVIKYAVIVSEEDIVSSSNWSQSKDIMKIVRSLTKMKQGVRNIISIDGELFECVFITKTKGFEIVGSGGKSTIVVANRGSITVVLEGQTVHNMSYLFHVRNALDLCFCISGDIHPNNGSPLPVSDTSIDRSRA